MAVTLNAGAGVLQERRNLEARLARDRLAHMLGLHPRTLGSLDADLAQKMARHLNLLNRRMQQLVDSSALDELTGVLRRAAGLEALERELHRARRFGDQRLVVAFIDVDGLKAVNDTAGHAAGDRLIRDVADRLRSRLRAYDLVIRWGGDEFVCVLPEAGLKEATRIMEAIGQEFAADTGQSFSIGYADVLPNEGAAEMVARADAALYSGRRDRRPARRRGRRSERVAAAIVATLAVVVALGIAVATATPSSALYGPHLQMLRVENSLSHSR